MRKALLVALLAVAFPVAASAHHVCARLPHAHHVVAAASSPGFPQIPIITPAVNGAFAIIQDAFGAGSGILTDTGQVIISIDPWGRPVYEDRGW